MHPALRKGPLFTKHPQFSTFFYKKNPKPNFPFFTKKHPHFISCLRACSVTCHPQKRWHLCFTKGAVGGISARLCHGFSSSSYAIEKAGCVFWILQGNVRVSVSRWLAKRYFSFSFRCCRISTSDRQKDMTVLMWMRSGVRGC